jgi:hypothetical protein
MQREGFICQDKDIYQITDWQIQREGFFCQDKGDLPKNRKANGGQGVLCVRIKRSVKEQLDRCDHEVLLSDQSRSDFVRIKKEV